MNKRIILNAFKQGTLSHTAVGTWAHPASRAADFGTLAYWTETARTLEDGFWDGLFIADVQGVLDSHGGSLEPALRDGIQTPSIDPLLAVSAMAAVTRHLGFAVTLSTTYEQPYALARKFGTLDLLTDGRIGWNIVTSALESAARNMGLATQPDHDTRYDIADEFMAVVYKLWEKSWDDGAVILDRAARQAVDPARVRGIGHRGAHFSVPDAALCAPGPQRSPVLFQAGSSERGRTFAATHAEAAFLALRKPEIARRVGDDIRARAVAAGRGADAVKILAMATIITAATDAEAEAIYRDQMAYVSTEGHLARLSAILQLDLTQLDPDQPLREVKTKGIQGVLDAYTKLDPDTVWTPRLIGENLGLAGGGALIVGGPQRAADQLQDWFESSGVDGFNVTDAMPLENYAAINRWLLPELRRRGLARDSYAGSTYRENLFGAGRSRLSADHPAHRVTIGASPESAA